MNKRWIQASTDKPCGCICQFPGFLFPSQYNRNRSTETKSNNCRACLSRNHCWTQLNSTPDVLQPSLEQRWSAVTSERAFTKLSDAWTLELTDDRCRFYGGAHTSHWNVLVLHCVEKLEYQISTVYPIEATLLSKKPQRIPKRVTQSVSIQAHHVCFSGVTTCTCRCQQGLQGCIHCMLPGSEAQTPEVNKWWC